MAESKFCRRKVLKNHGFKVIMNFVCAEAVGSSHLCLAERGRKMMKKHKAVWAAVILGLALAGCGAREQAGGWNGDSNSIYVNKAMAVASAMAVTGKKSNDLYDQEELRAFVAEKVAEYNASNGGIAAWENSEGAEKLPVALKSCTLEGTTGILTFEYASADDFVKFSRETGDNTHTITALSVKKVSDARAAGELADGKFVNLAGKAAELGDVTRQAEKSIVVAAEGKAVIHTEGRITYVSEGVALHDSYTAVTAEGTNYIIFQ